MGDSLEWRGHHRRAFDLAVASKHLVSVAEVMIDPHVKRIRAGRVQCGYLVVILHATQICCWIELHELNGVAVQAIRREQIPGTSIPHITSSYCRQSSDRVHLTAPRRPCRRSL